MSLPHSVINDFNPTDKVLFNIEFQFLPISAASNLERSESTLVWDAIFWVSYQSKEHVTSELNGCIHIGVDINTAKEHFTTS